MKKEIICFTLILCFLCLPQKAIATFREDIREIIEYQGDTSDNDLKLRGQILYGNASWYGLKFQGRRTSNGETFNKDKLTAAHKTLPFDTKVRVTNLKNNKSVVVRINDRGPYRGNRIIDLSEKAAHKIDSKKQGIAYVKVQVLGQ